MSVSRHPLDKFFADLDEQGARQAKEESRDKPQGAEAAW
jgi:hypothetical protein